MLAGSPGLLLPGRRPCQPPRPACSRLTRRRSGVRVAAFWPGWNTKSDGDTDDEIFTAAAVSNQGQGRQARRQHEAKHAALRPTEEPPAPPRQTLPQFAAALAFVTVGAFFIGSAIRKYILQPAPLSEAGPDGGPDGGSSKFGRQRRRSSGGGGKAPSVQDLIRQQVGGRAVPYSRPSTGDSVLSSAVVEASREQAAAVHAAAAAQAAQAPPPAVGTPPAGPPAGAAAGAAAPDAAAALPQTPTAPAEVQPAAAAAAAAEPLPPAEPASAASPESPAPSASAPAAAAADAAAADTGAGLTGEQQAGCDEAQVQGEPAPGSWCETTLEPALRAAAAAKQAAGAAEQRHAEAPEAAAAPEQRPAAAAEAEGAAAVAADAAEAAEERLSAVQQWERRLPVAAAAAAPLLACEQVWVACRQTPQGPVALRLLFPVPGLGEQRCVALFQDKADALAAQRALLRILGLDTSLQPLAVPTLLADAAERQRCAAFYAAGSLAEVLAAVEDAALQQELVAGMRRWKAGAAAAVGRDGGSGGSEEEEKERAVDVAELLQAALQQQAAVLDSEQLGEAAACLAAQLATMTEGAGAAAAAAGVAAPAAQQQQQQQPAAAEAAEAAAQRQPAAAEAAAQRQPAPEGGAPAAAAGQSQQAGWDPQAEKLQRRRSDPGWWLTLPVLHVPQLLYPDGGKGLMSVPLSVPVALSQQQQQGGQAAGGGAAVAPAAAAAVAPAGGAGAGAVRERRLVAFVDVKDAEALADCSLKDAGASAGGATNIQLVSVPPAQLRQHAEAHGCHVAALPPGSLSLPPGASYDDAVTAVVEAVEKQFYEQLLAAAGGSIGGSGGASKMAHT